jgi:hypothetical protein
MKLIALFLAPRSLVVLMRQNASNVKNDRLEMGVPIANAKPDQIGGL